MKSNGVLFRRGVPFALGGDDMDEDRAMELPDIPKVLNEGVDLMAGQRADVLEPELLKKQARQKESLKGLFGVFSPLQGWTSDARKVFEKAFDFVPETSRQMSGHQPVQVRREGADIGGDGKFIVIQYHDQVFIHGPSLVQSLKGQTGRHGAIADDGDDFVAFRL